VAARRVFRSCTTCAPHWAVREHRDRGGGTPDMHRVGHAFIKTRMREIDALFAARSAATTTSATSPTPTPAWCPPSSCSRWWPAPGGRCRSWSPSSASGTTSRVRSTRTVADVRRPCGGCASAIRTACRPRSTVSSVESDDWHFNVRPQHRAAAARLTSNRHAPSRTWSAVVMRCSRSSARSGRTNTGRSRADELEIHYTRRSRRGGARGSASASVPARGC